MDTVLQIKNVSHYFGKKNVLYNVNFDIEQGSFVSLVGPSGCGKSTLFRAILGTHPPRCGCVQMKNKIITTPTRNVGIVYQHYSLYDFLTVEENVAFGLLLDKSSLYSRNLRPIWWYKLKKKHIEEAKEWLEELDLKHAIGNYPTQLSGGMRQRVAIAQALILKPKVVLLDEPFGALDESTREDLQVMLLHLRQENLNAIAENKEPPYTVIMVTHELNEAFYIGDRVVGLSQYWKCGEECGLDLGATICYDEKTPVFLPDDPRDFTRFADHKERLKKIVFSEELIEI